MKLMKINKKKKEYNAIYAALLRSKIEDDKKDWKSKIYKQDDFTVKVTKKG